MRTRILVIEDNPANLELMRYLLEAFGYRALTATSGAEGIAVALRERPSLIVCDVQMPGLDGYETLRELRGHAVLAKIPVVAVTALAMVGDREKILAAGFAGYLAKPIEPDSFVTSVTAWLPPELRSASRSPPEASSGSQAVGAATGPLLLAVDNHAVNLELASGLFRNFGFEVVTTSDPARALELARARVPDIVLSDVCMPEGTGYELVRAFKSDPRLERVPVILITSTLDSEAERQKGLALGAARFLFRPIEPPVLLAEIRACLEEARRTAWPRS